MTKKTPGALDRAVARMMDLDSPTYGDERERAVFMEATAFGQTLAIYLGLAGALVAAVLGQLLVPVVLLALMWVPSVASIWYASRRGVDVADMGSRASRKTRAGVAASIFGGLVLTCGAMLYTLLVGHGLVPVPEVDLTGPEHEGVLRSALTGALVGGAGGALVGAVISARKRRRTAAEPAGDDLDDLD
ncbi:hypothetical protein [Georgenia faecalis]|uniref:hypothetical protein n=1 Tax=Georgenia faecalis TaxID=2483799 RepID=UPI0019CF5366|nr:hypothetical protein [Georgenia faecalis]